MKRLLQEAFDIIAPSLGEPLAARTLRPALREGLGTLAPILKVGLECGLAETARQVDVQQAIVARHGEHHLLMAHVAHMVAEHGDALDPGWHRILDVCQRWTEGPYEPWLAELWFEYDVTQALSKGQLPSMFVQVPHGGQGPTARACIEEITEQLWGRTIPALLQTHLRTCFEEAPGRAWVSHVGTMLARPVDALRVNVKGLRPEDADGLLDRLGWTGPTGEVAPLMAWLLRYADHVTVCLDLGERVYPRIGMEGFFRDPPSVDLRWRGLLDALVDRGTCTTVKRDALFRWVGSDQPPTAPAPWPAALVARALLEPERLGAIARTLNHLKVVYQPTHPLEAKAYLGFGHLWGQSTAPEAAADDGSHGVKSESRSARVPPVALPTEAELTCAIERAVTFLSRARNQAGWWRDYYGMVGTSDEYVTAYVGAALAAVGSPAAHALAEQAWSLLAECRPDHVGWGWNVCLPPDADSTSWAVRLGRAVGAASDPRLLAAETFVFRHRAPAGGLASYITEVLPASSVGWHAPLQPCISSVAAWIPSAGSELLPYLRGAQRADGSWRSYWSDEDAYPTGLAAEVLARWGRHEDRAPLQAAAAWAAKRVGPDGAVRDDGLGMDSPWATAWAARILAATNAYPEVRQQTIRWLLTHQRPDGSWKASGRSRAPAANVLDPDAEPDAHGVYLDSERTYTTATVLVALAGGPDA